MIRKADNGDLGGILSLVERAVKNMLGQNILQWDHTYPAGVLPNDAKAGQLFLIEAEGVPAGIMVLNEEQAPEYASVSWTCSGKILAVHRLVVDPAHQGKRLASRLMDFAESEAALRGYDCIRLDTFSGNPMAIRLYEGRGYLKAGTVSFRDMDFFCYEKKVGS